MKKMLGLEYKKFINADWDALLGMTGVYMDGQEVTANGAAEPDDTDDIPDDAKVIIHCGCVMADTHIDMSLVDLYSRWKKQQTHTTMTLWIPNEYVDYINAQVASVNGKVLK